MTLCFNAGPRCLTGCCEINGTAYEIEESDTLRADAVRLSPHADVLWGAEGGWILKALEPGRDKFNPAAGRALACDIPPLPEPVEITGPWEVQFAPRWGGSGKATF
jgi:hypothetical protein